MSPDLQHPDDSAGKPETPRHVLTFGGRGTEPGQLHIPIDIAIDRDDNLFVSDFYNGRIQKFDTQGNHLAVYPTPPNPGGIAVDADGTIYLSHFSVRHEGIEKQPDCLRVYDKDGCILDQWCSSGTKIGQLASPGGIVIGPDGLIYVADQTNRRVQVFDKNGNWARGWGKYGLEPGQFGGNCPPDFRVGGPQFLAIDNCGYIYTTEGTVGRIQKFTLDGEFLGCWGDNEDRAGGFGRLLAADPVDLVGPIGIVAAPNGTIWVSCVGGLIQEFNAQGQYLRGFGDEQGQEPGQFSAPHGMAFDSEGFMYVADTLNHRVQKFAV